MKSLRISLSFSEEMLARVDQAAKDSFSTRSNFIREAVAMRLNNQHVVSRPKENEFMKQLEAMAAREDEAEDNLFDL